MGPEPSLLSEAEARLWFSREVPVADFRRKRVLVIVPDATRTAPLPLLFDASVPAWPAWPPAFRF